MRVRDRQTGQPSFVLGGQYPITVYYVNRWMQESVKRYAKEMQRSEGIPLHIRVGLNSGEVVIRSIGNDLHMDYTAVGQTAHLAARSFT